MFLWLFVVVKVLMFMSKGVKDVVCPFYRLSRDFTVRFCDNLVDGVPSCVVDEFYPDLDLFSFKDIREYEKYIDGISICSHFVRSDVYSASFSMKSECFFGGLCVHPLVCGYGACSVNCSRFKSGV